MQSTLLPGNAPPSRESTAWTGRNCENDACERVVSACHLKCSCESNLSEVVWLTTEEMTMFAPLTVAMLDISMITSKLNSTDVQSCPNFNHSDTSCLDSLEQILQRLGYTGAL
jgi:hypothetical protein